MIALVAKLNLRARSLSTQLEIPRWIWTYFLSDLSSSSNIYYKMIYIRIFCGFWNKYRNCAFEIFCGVLVYIPWHRPLLAQPGPWREAIHCALLSSFICASILIATCLLLAASLAAGVIRPTLAKVHMACALTAHVETMSPSFAVILRTSIFTLFKASVFG